MRKGRLRQDRAQLRKNSRTRPSWLLICRCVDSGAAGHAGDGPRRGGARCVVANELCPTSAAFKPVAFCPMRSWPGCSRLGRPRGELEEDIFEVVFAAECAQLVEGSLGGEFAFSNDDGVSTKPRYVIHEMRREDHCHALCGGVMD